jgi:long-chain acyl-CoA synthetase
VSILACFHSGLVAAPVNIRFKPAEVAYVLQHAGARRAVVHPSLAEAVRGVQADCPNLEQIDIKLPESAAGRDEGEVEDDAAALLLYTSGTTAQPKGVTHTPQTLQASAETMRPLGFDETSVVLVSMSMMHTAGLCGSLLPTLVTGGKAVLLPRFEAGELLDLVEKHRCTWSLVLPALLQALAVEQERRPRDLGSMRAWLSGGDAVPVSLQE